jgi:hypothetical protein
MINHLSIGRGGPNHDRKLADGHHRRPHVRHEGSPVAISTTDSGSVSVTITSTTKECLCQTK